MNILRINDYRGWSLLDYWVYKDVYYNLIGALAYDIILNGVSDNKLDAIDELMKKYENSLMYEYIDVKLNFELDWEQAKNNENYFLDEWNGPVVNKVYIKDFYWDYNKTIDGITASNMNCSFYCTAAEYQKYLNDKNIIELDLERGK